MHVVRPQSLWIVLIALGLLAIVFGVRWQRSRSAAMIAAPFGRTLTITGPLTGTSGDFHVADARFTEGVIVANGRDEAVSRVLTPLIGRSVTLRGLTTVSTDQHTLGDLYVEQVNGTTVVTAAQLSHAASSLADHHQNTDAQPAAFNQFSPPIQACLVAALGSTEAATSFFTAPGASTSPPALAAVNHCFARADG